MTNKFYYQGNILQQLKGFCATVELGTISRAANYLSISHSAVSLQIKSLERDFKCVLIQRNGPQIEVTAAGRKLYDRAVPYLNGISGLYSEMQADNDQSTHIGVGVNHSVFHYLLPSLLPKFYIDHPSVGVDIVFGDLDFLIAQVVEERVEIALMPRRHHFPFPSSCEFFKTISFPVSLISRRDHPLAGKANLTLKEISDYELILPSPQMRVVPTLYDGFDDQHLHKKQRTRFSNIETARKFIEMGLGVNISSEIVPEPDHPILCATPLGHIFPPADYGYVVKRNRRLSSEVDAFIQRVKLFTEWGQQTVSMGSGPYVSRKGQVTCGYSICCCVRDRGLRVL